jgi:hypothetical protein
MTMLITARLRLTLVLVVAALTLLSATSLTAQDVLTNDSVVSMKKAGLSDSLILAKIRSSATKFDTSTKGLIALKNAGISDQIIEAMVNHSGAAAAPAPPQQAAPPATATTTPGAARQSISYLSGGKAVELAMAVAAFEFSNSPFDAKSELVLRGRKAQYRITDKKPTFYSAWSANDAPLVRLRPGKDHDDRNLKIAGGSYAPYGGSYKYGVRSEDRIDLEPAEKDGRGYYRLTPREPLKPGEYGFVVTLGTTGTSGQIYDFGVD